MSNGSRGGIGFVVAVVAVFGAIFAGVLFGGGILSSFGAGPDARAEAGLGGVDKGAANEAAVYVALQRHFPEAYAEVERAATDAIKARKPVAETDAWTMDFMERFSRANAKYVAKASRDALVALLMAERDYIVALQLHDEKLCAQFGMTGGVPETAKLNSALDSLGSIWVVAAIEAAAAGRDRPVEWGRPTTMDATALVKALDRQGVDGLRILNGGPGALARAPAGEQCRISTAIFRAMGELAPDSAARIRAEQVRDAIRGG